MIKKNSPRKLSFKLEHGTFKLFNASRLISGFKPSSNNVKFHGISKDQRNGERG